MLQYRLMIPRECLDCHKSPREMIACGVIGEVGEGELYLLACSDQDLQNVSLPRGDGGPKPNKKRSRIAYGVIYGHVRHTSEE